MDAYRNQKAIEQLREDLEKEVTSLKRDFAALYEYVQSLSKQKSSFFNKKGAIE